MSENKTSKIMKVLCSVLSSLCCWRLPEDDGGPPLSHNEEILLRLQVLEDRFQAQTRAINAHKKRLGLMDDRQMKQYKDRFVMNMYKSSTFSN